MAQSGFPAAEPTATDQTPTTTSPWRRAHLLALGWAAVAALVVVVLTLVGIPTDPAHTAGFGSQVQRPAQFSVAATVLLGALVAWRWAAAGTVLLAVAGTGLIVFAGLEYPPLTTLGLGIAVGVAPAVLWVVWQRDRPGIVVAAMAAATAMAVAVTWVGVDRAYDAAYGPTHPGSAARSLPVDRVEWLWLGALDTQGVTVVAGVRGASSVAVVAEADAGGDPVRAAALPVDGTEVVRARLSGLAADTGYRLRIEVDGRPDDGRGVGTFRTTPDGPASFRFVVGACARTDSNGAVFDAMAAEDPLFYLNLGDLHYGNLERRDPGAYRTAYARLLGQAGQAALYRRVPIAYVWDDHDYGPNDSDAGAPGRDAARRAYRQVVPHYDLPAGSEGAIYQAFTVGRVRVVLTDGRSERTDDSMLGAEQRRWLIGELTTAARTHAVVIWGNPVPWIAEAARGADSWGGYPDERREIADALVAAGVDNLVMLSGDAHMVALDDGTNSDYSAARVGGFPVLHAAALDRPGRVKGGPYSAGAFPGGGQYGLVEVVDDGATVEMTLSGRTWNGETLVSESFRFATS